MCHTLHFAPVYPSTDLFVFVPAERSVSGQRPGWWHHNSSGAGDAPSDDTAPAEPLGRALSGKSTTPQASYGVLIRDSPPTVPPQGIPEVGVDGILQLGWINWSPISIPTEPDQIVPRDRCLSQMSILLLFLHPDNFSALFEGEGDAKFHEAREYFLSPSLWYTRSRC